MKHKHYWAKIVVSGKDGIYKCDCGEAKEVIDGKITYFKYAGRINWKEIYRKLSLN